jgi:DNA polymerase-3 subunit epsilon/ATP-dependent DNA helicase DinG
LGPLEAEGIRVLAQGVDGPPNRLMEAFQAEPRSVLLGTSSFWEGVDMSEGALKVLVLARLPFAVPTEPVFAARSELFDEPFTQYTVPQAVLRFRQGFGRLIRRREDRGVVVVLDRRLVSRGYGASFRNSLPPCDFKTPSLAKLAEEVKRWIGG